MSQNMIEKAAQLEKAEGPFGKENISLIEEFAKSMMRVYYQTSYQASDYAKHKPLRELLKGFRLYRNLGRADQRLVMAGEVKRILENPPKYMAVDFWVTPETQAVAIVDQFFGLVDNLFGGMPNLVSRHANSLIHAYDLALELHWREIYCERGQEFIRRREDKLAELTKERETLAKTADTSEQDAKRLEEVDAEIARIRGEIAEKKAMMEKISKEKEEESE